MLFVKIARFPPEDYEAVINSPINLQFLYPFPSNNSGYVAEFIINKEKRYGGCQKIEELTTSAFLSHKRSSAQGRMINGNK